MKQIIGLFIITFLLSSCASDSESNSTDANSLEGTWTWQKTCGGIAGITISPTTAGYTQKLVFTAQGKAIFYKNNLEVSNQFYQLTTGKSIYDSKNHNLLKIGEIEYVLNLENSSLSLGDNYADGFVNFYTK